MNQPFLDPAFLQVVGEMTISFALLDAMLSHVFNTMEGNADMSRIATMPYGEKVDQFIRFVKFEFAELGSSNFTAKQLDKLKNDLTGVASLRNSFNHDSWTMEIGGRMTLKSLKRKGVPERYPTPEKIRKLADRIWAVRSALADVMNEHTRLRRAKQR